jgi:hypothetical protein
MANLIVTVTNVDMDGYCGRDHHPARADVGRVADVLRVCQDGPSGFEDEAEAPVVFFECRFRDGRRELVELMEFEVAFARG